MNFWKISKDIILLSVRPYLYSVYYVNESTSSPINDVDLYVIIRELPDSIFNIFPVFICRWEIHTYMGLSFRKVAYMENIWTEEG
jgi:hypothetical protein